MQQQVLQKKLDKVIHLVLIKGDGMDIMEQLQKVINQVEKIDYKSVYIEIETKNDRFTMNKIKSKNQIGFETKGGE